MDQGADNNGENEEMINESDKEECSGDEFNSDSSSSDDYESSDFDGEDSEKDKEYNLILTDIEKQFELVRSLYKSEKNFEIDTKMRQILDESAPEYQQPLNELMENKEIRLQIAKLIKKYRMDNLLSFYDAEKLAAEQNFKNEKELLKDSIQESIEEKIRKLNEERYKADSEFFSETHYLKKKRKYIYSDDPYQDPKRRKAVTTAGPFVIHLLKDEEIIEDINFIKCCLRSQKYNKQWNHYPK